MNPYDKILVTLYIVALVAIVVELFQFWGLAIIFILILILTLVQKTYFDERIENVRKERSAIVDSVSDRLDVFTKKIDDLQYNLDRNMFAVQHRLEERVEEVRHEQDIEMHKNYRELARGIFELENRFNSTKKTLSAALGALDDRLRESEEE